MKEFDLGFNMKNTVKVSVAFDFKGQHFAPELELDLDSYMQASGCLPDLFSLLARASKIGVYSYEYEMLQAETLVYSQAEGLVTNFIVDGVLDLEGFESAWLEIEAMKKLSVIAKQTMDVDDLSAQLELQNALLAAYRLGQSEPVKEEEVMSYSF